MDTLRGGTGDDDLFERVGNDTLIGGGGPTSARVTRAARLRSAAERALVEALRRGLRAAPLAASEATFRV